jgi:hypothetical protein
VIVHCCRNFYTIVILLRYCVVWRVNVLFRAAILACSSYVALGLGDYVNALEYGQQLLSLPHLSGVHRYLGHLYVAESLVNQGRIPEAIHHLAPETVTDVSHSFQTSEGGDPGTSNCIYMSMHLPVFLFQRQS